MNKKQKAARLSIFSNSMLIVLKVIAGVWSGSVSILSEAIHSALDLIASVIAFFAVKISAKPADHDHPYGHGKFENVSGVIEALLIFAAAVWIIYESIEKILSGDFSIRNTSAIQLGIVVMLISGVVNLIVSRRLYKVARETDSVALEADALHLRTDVYTSIGVSIGLLVMYLTEWYFIDPIIAIGVALLILAETYRLMKKAFTPLLDTSLPQNEIDTIESIVCKNLPDMYHLKEIKTRKSGPLSHIEIFVDVPGSCVMHTIEQNNRALKNSLYKRFPASDVTVVVSEMIVADESAIDQRR